MPTKSIDDAGDDGRLSAADPGHQIKAENTNQTPVDAADHDQGPAILSSTDMIPLAPFRFGIQASVRSFFSIYTCGM